MWGVPNDMVANGGHGIDQGQADGRSRPARRMPPRRWSPERTVLCLVAGAGVLGALARYAISRLLPVPAGRFPWSYLWISVTGSLLIGFVLALLSERFSRARVARPLVVTGFLRACTTFSTYMVDTDMLLRAYDLATATIYAMTSTIRGVLAAFTGVVGARFLVRPDHRLNEKMG